MSRLSLPAVYLLTVCALGFAGAQAVTSSSTKLPSANSQDAEFFEKQVRPLLVENCFACHSGKTTMGGLRLDSRATLLKGGARGAAITPGDADKSLLLKAIGYHETGLQMPPKGKLPDDKIAVLTEWIKRGAVWPEKAGDRGQGTGDSKGKTPPGKFVFDLQGRAKHWSFQPIRKSALPAVKNLAWCKTPIDRFILAKLEAKGLKPAPPADRRTLLRRVTYDLIGLPPTPAEINDFLADKSPNAYEKVVERLLASPHYGERWGRHWLDLVRYAETDGHEWDFEKPGAWRYRDYVIRAFNADLPYNQFVREQIAGDLLPNPRWNPTEKLNESLLATAFWYLGEGKHSPVDLRDDQAERIDNQIDVFGKTFLGLSLGCARCHDHKFDPVSAKDYYALSGYLHSSRYQLAFLDAPDRTRASCEELEKLNAQMEPLAVSSSNVGTPHDPADAIVFADFTGSDWKGWTAAGAAFGTRPRSQAVRVVQDKSGARVERIGGQFGAGIADSGGLSDKLQGALRSPDFVIGKAKILYHVAGRGAKIRLVIDGYYRIQDPIYGALDFTVSNEDKFAWHTQDVKQWLGHRAYVEILDSGSGRILVDRIVFSDQDPPADAPIPTVRNVALNTSVPDPNAPAYRAALAPLLEQRQKVEAQIPDAQTALATLDGSGEDDHVHLRGSSKTLGPLVPRRFLEVCAGAKQPAPASGSGRLALADRLLSPSDTLLPRVIVNRVWQHHFGEGLVRTVDDFGLRGDAPTHPELLDWLAATFVSNGEILTTKSRSHEGNTKGKEKAHAETQRRREERKKKGSISDTRHPIPDTRACNWSLKKLHRLMVLSAAYRMASQGDAKAEQADPQNKLLHRMSVRRLEAEAVRDAVLAVSGRLDQTLYGPSVQPFLTPFTEGRGKPASGPLDGAGRRSIYLAVRRNFLIPMFLAFDFPVPFNCTGKRSVSNVPAQALTLMNNPLVVEQAKVWAQKVLGDKTLTTTEQRVTQMYVTAYGRPPTAAELADALDFLTEQGKLYGSADDLRAWTDLCHVLYNVKEFIFVN